MSERTERSARRGREPAPVFVGLALLAVLGVAACNGSDDGNALQKINGSVHVAAGNVPSAAGTVNGSIHIDDDAAVTSAKTVNGGIHLGAHATADALETVNGSIVIGAGAHVAKQAETVNGAIDVREGAEVLGAVGNVNGRIELTGAHVAKGIKTTDGDIKISGGSKVEGGILVGKSNDFVHFGAVPRIEIGPGSSVQGELRFERDVKLYVSDKAAIGTVTGATPIAFGGDSAPQG
ncbi:MAG: hypothetical protein JWN43_2308 [Gammaproteobacteria bacterium]|nr:hypothetical protein [Gammaproteobacteria bacterium]